MFLVYVFIKYTLYVYLKVYYSAIRALFKTLIKCKIKTTIMISSSQFCWDKFIFLTNYDSLALTVICHANNSFTPI